MKKKILIIPSWYPSSHDRINGSFFHEQAALLSSQYDIRVLSIIDLGRPSFYSLLKRSLKPLSEWADYLLGNKRRVLYASNDSLNHPHLIQYTVRLLSLSEPHRYFRLRNLYLSVASQIFDHSWKPDLIHAHSAYVAGLVASILSRKYDIPYALTEHVPFSIANYPQSLRHNIVSAFANADAVLSISRDKVRQLGMSGILVDTHLVYNYVDESSFDMVCKDYQPLTPLSLVTIGSASPFKDHQTLIRALQILLHKRIPFHMTLIGLGVGGHLYEQTLSLIKVCRLSSHVTIIDQLDRSSLPRYLSSHTVFVMTSIAEGLPVSVLEALCCGLFVVSTRHGGTEDILDAKSGVLVDVRDHQGIAQTLEDIYTGRIKFNPFTIREKIVSICGRQAFANRLSSYYNLCIERSLNSERR